MKEIINRILLPFKLVVPQPIIKKIPGLTTNEDIRTNRVLQHISSSMTVLDIGCGNNLLISRHRARGGLGIGVDVYAWGEIDLQIDVNYRGVVYGTQLDAEYFKEKGSGHIINISSMAGITFLPGLSVYCGTKFAVRGFSLSAAYDLAPYNVKVTVVCPDAVATPLLNQSSGTDAGAMVFSGGKLLTVEQIGGAIVGKVMSKQPMEFSMPFSRLVLSKAASLMPWTGKLLLPMLMKKGRSQRTDWKEAK